MGTVDIIYIISGDLWAGAESQVFNTLYDLAKTSRFFYAVILFNNGILAKKLQETCITCFVIDETKYNGFMMLFKISVLLKRLNPKIVHVHAYKEHVLGKIACILSNTKAHIVRTFHGMSEVPAGLSFLKNIRSNIVYRIEKIFMKNCNLIAVSKDFEASLSLIYPDAFVTQIYNGIPVPQIKDFSKKQVRKKYDIVENMFWIGTLARLEKVKNLEMLINAGTKLKESNVDFRISIFGEGRLMRVLQDKINQSSLENNVFLEGFVDNILPVISSFDLFVLCSLHEGLPMSLLEAMLAETPVVCTSVGGIKEIIADRNTGLLVANNDVQALYEAIIELNDNPRLKDNLRENAKKEIEKKFLIRNTNKKLEFFYHNLILQDN